MINFDFSEYVKAQKNPLKRAATFENNYAYSGDLRILNIIEQIKPVKLAVEATVRFWKGIAKNDLLGSSIRVTRNQFPEVYEIAERCAKKLGIPVPTLYVHQMHGIINAMTYGTKEDSYILIYTDTIQALTEEELAFIIGHECGHIQNQHVVYHTAAYYLTNMASIYIAWVITPAVLALNAWLRRSEITADRSGLICCGDEMIAINAMLKIIMGASKLFNKINLEEYLEQLKDVKDGIGRLAELNKSHPYLPKRIEALRIFKDTKYFRENVLNQEGGISLEEADQKVHAVIKIL